MATDRESEDGVAVPETCPRCGDEDRPCLCDGLTDAEWERQEREGRKFEAWKERESEK